VVPCFLAIRLIAVPLRDGFDEIIANRTLARAFLGH
jgi:hypothetical protein